MNYKYFKLLYAILLLGALSACQLAKEQGNDTAQDRFAGFYITTEWIDFTALNQDLVNQQTDLLSDIHQSNRLYADEVYFSPESKPEFVFPGVDGMAFFTALFPQTSERDSYLASVVDPQLTDTKLSIVASTDYKTQLEGTIYISPNSRETVFHMNAVYQRADGKIYLTNGRGLSSSSMEQEGITMTYDQTATTTQTVNKEQTSDTTYVKLSITTLFPAKDIFLLQMDATDTLIEKTAYTPETMPDSIKLNVDTDYFIVENHKQDLLGNPIITRTIHGKDTESIHWFAAQENYVLVKHAASISWAE